MSLFDFVYQEKLWIPESPSGSLSASGMAYNGDELLLMGASQGGFVSSLAAAKPENKVSKLVLFYPASVIKMDPYSEIVKYEGPVLIVHGTKDAIVNPEYAKRALEAYGADRAKLVIIEDGEHGFKGEHDVQAQEALTVFAK